MAYNDIKKRYEAIAASAKPDIEISSNLHDCSYDSRNDFYMINNNFSSCFSFEKVRDFLFGGVDGIRACDALYFSDKKETLLFVEFKNRPYNSSYTSIPELIAEQAADSLYVHYVACNGFVDPDSALLDFAAVLSFEKNQDAPFQKTSFIMMAISGETDNGAFSNETNSLLKALIKSKIAERHPEVLLDFNFVGIYKSLSFNAVFLAY